MRVISTIAFIFLISTLIHSQQVTTLTGQLNASGGLSVDSSGNIYVANFGETLSGGGEEVYKISPDGEVEVFATGLNGASGNFYYDGFLYQSNINSGVISRIDANGNVENISSGHASPVGVAIDKDGVLFVANCGANSIRKVNPDGSSTILAQSILLSCPNGLTSDENGNLYTCNFNNGFVVKITPEGQVSVIATLPGSNNGHLTYRNGRLYVVDRGGNRIYEVELDGTTKILAGSGNNGNDDGDAFSATFSRPNGIGLSPDGNTIYISDKVSTNSAQDINPVLVRKIEGVIDNVTDVEENNSEIISEYKLNQNYPNPFNPNTVISYHLSAISEVKLKVFDVLGNQITTLVDEQQSAGTYDVQFNAEQLVSGIYFYTLQAGSFIESKKMILLR